MKQKQTQTFFIIILFIGFIALGGVLNNIEAYEGEQRQDGLLLIKNKSSHKETGNVSREIGQVSTEANPLCQLDAVICPNEKQGTIRTISAYNIGDPSQTDDDPCIMASGLNGCELLEKGINICAANFVPLHTKLAIHNFGQCEVLDRMNARYKNAVDIGMKLSEKERALHFGVQRLLVNEL